MAQHMHPFKYYLSDQKTEPLPELRALHLKNSKFKLAVAKEKILLMNKVMEKISYEGRVRAECTSQSLYR